MTRTAWWLQHAKLALVAALVSAVPLSPSSTLAAVNYGLQLPWPQGASYGISGYTYGCGDHTGYDGYAIDFGLGWQNQVAAVASGTAYTAWDAGGYGNYVYINHGGGYYTLYAHLYSFSISNGAHVSQGQVIGLSDSTGNSTGNHLHFSMRSGGLWANAYQPEAMSDYTGFGNWGYHTPPTCSFTASPSYTSYPGYVYGSVSQAGPDVPEKAQLGQGCCTSLGGGTWNAPAIVQYQSNAYYIVVGTDNNLWMRTDSQAWSAIGNSGTYCKGFPYRPGATVVGSTLYIVCVGSTGDIYLVWTRLGSWPPPTLQGVQDYGGSPTGGPGVATIGGTLTVLDVGQTNGGANVYSATSPNSWSPVSNWFCNWAIGFASAYGTAYMACDGTNSALWWAYNSGSGWSSAYSLGGTVRDGPTVAPTAGNAMFYIEGSDGQIWDNSTDGNTGTWHADGGAIALGTAASGL